MDKEERNKQFANDVVYAGTHLAACTVLDIAIDPHINQYVQDKLAPSFKGQEVHARKAEVISDVSASVIFLGLQRFFPGVVNGIKKAMKPLLNPIYEKIGNNRLQEWAERHHVDPASKEFRNKLDEWKDQQAGNFAKSSVIAGLSAAGNVVAQIKLGNPRPKWVITTGKLSGAAVTVGVILGVRALAPRGMHKVDKNINKYVAMPLINVTQKLFGVAGLATEEDIISAPPSQSTAPVTQADTAKWAKEKVQKLVSETPSPASYKQRVDNEARDAAIAR